MSVDERYLARWRKQQQANRQRAWDRQLIERQRRRASMALAPEPQRDQGSENVEFWYRGMWQQARLERWRVEDGEFSHEAYLAWWRQNGGEGEGYTIARHFENHMKCCSSRGWLKGASAVAVFDVLLTRYGPLLAAEGFRRWLAAQARADCEHPRRG